MEEEVLTVKEICARFKVSAETVRTRIQRGELLAKKITQGPQGQWRVPVEAARQMFGAV